MEPSRRARPLFLARPSRRRTFASIVNHDIITIAGSAGGLSVLLRLAEELPGDLPASLFVAVHTVPGRYSHLEDLLSGRSRLRSSFPTHNQKLERGNIYIAPPDNHLLVRRGFMEVVRGPRENGHRPAADPLFRSAAAAFGPRVVGVVLSGYQDCGTAGMMSIKARGGVSVVQDPKSAEVPDMPRSVLDRVPVDHVVEPGELAALLTRLATTAVSERHLLQPDRAIRQLEGAAKGERAELVCPICQGVLTETALGEFVHFRCHVGHAFSLDSLVSEQNEEMERALWAAARALEESAALSRRLSQSARGELRRRYTERATSQCHHAELIREILLRGATAFRAEEQRPLSEDEPGGSRSTR